MEQDGLGEVESPSYLHVEMGMEEGDGAVNCWVDKEEGHLIMRVQWEGDSGPWVENERISVHHTAGHLSEFLAVLGVILSQEQSHSSCSFPSFALSALSVHLHPSSFVQPCHWISSPSPSVLSFFGG